MELYIDSGTHVDQIVDRMAKIEENIGAPDVVFAEGAGPSTDPDQIKSITSILPIAPLLAAAVICQIYIVIEVRGWILEQLTSGKTGRDAEIVHQLESTYDSDSIEVDTVSLPAYIHDYRVPWGITNWGSIVLISVLRFPWSMSMWDVFVYSTGLLAVGYLCLLLLLGIANANRDEAMAQAVTNNASEYETACMIVGEAHHPGVGEQLQSESSVEVINPEPENLDRRSHIFLIWIGAMEKLRQLFRP